MQLPGFLCGGTRCGAVCLAPGRATSHEPAPAGRSMQDAENGLRRIYLPKLFGKWSKVARSRFFDVEDRPIGTASTSLGHFRDPDPVASSIFQTVSPRTPANRARRRAGTGNAPALLLA